ncbi:MAG: hypothetical protein AAGA77_19130 [Bacteroidota bacterium]
MDEYNELIDAYLRDELQGEQKIKFEEQLSKDEELNRQFQVALEIKQALRYNDLSAKLETIKAMDAVSSGANQKKNRLYGLILICVLALAALLWYFNRPPVTDESHKLNDNYAHLFETESFNSFIKHTTTRSNSSPASFEDKQQKAYDLFSAQAFEYAIPLLTELWEQHNDTLAYYYLGISYLGENKLSEAEKILNSQVVANYENPLSQ